MSKRAPAKGAQSAPGVPAFYDADGVLNSLSKTEFPEAAEGQAAYCDYQIEKWKMKKQIVLGKLDPKVKAKNKINYYKKLIEKFEKELKEDGGK